MSLFLPSRAQWTASVGSDCLVGVCARRRSNFLLLCQKKVTKEKASQVRRPCASLRAHCAVQLWREGSQTRCAQTAPLLFPPKPVLLTGSHGRGSGEPAATPVVGVAVQQQPLVFGFLRRYEEASSAGWGGSGLALFERSEFSQTPLHLSNAAYRRSRATSSARLFFGYFLLAKQKKVPRQPGRDPANRSHFFCAEAWSAQHARNAQ